MKSPAIFYYIHDPMCSWCWGHRAAWDQLRAQLSSLVEVRYCVGGLAPDSDQPMPLATREMVQANWQRVREVTGAKLNDDFWRSNTPRRSTYPACRATIAARWQGAEEAMINALQLAYYQRAMNPSDTSVHLQLAHELGLDVSRFGQDLHSSELQRTFVDEMAFARALPIQGFPSMVLHIKDQHFPIELDYGDGQGALTAVKNLLSQKS